MVFKLCTSNRASHPFRSFLPYSPQRHSKHEYQCKTAPHLHYTPAPYSVILKSQRNIQSAVYSFHSGPVVIFGFPFITTAIHFVEYLRLCMLLQDSSFLCSPFPFHNHCCSLFFFTVLRVITEYFTIFIVICIFIPGYLFFTLVLPHAPFVYYCNDVVFFFI